MELSGCVSIVTGVARGIGQAVAETYAQRGARVAIVDILADALAETASAIRSTGGRVLPLAGDVSDPVQVEAVFKRVEHELGPLDILVNCAGVLRTIGQYGKLPRKLGRARLT